MKFITPFGKTEDYLLTFLIFRLYLGKRFLKNRRGIFSDDEEEDEDYKEFEKEQQEKKLIKQLKKEQKKKIKENKRKNGRAKK